MLRKIFAVVLSITAVVVLFTACTGNGVNTTTEDPLSTSGSTTTTTTTTTEPTSTTGVTFILTTNESKQAPWYSTTRFVPAPVASTTTTTSNSPTSMSNNYDNITYPTANAITPSVSAVTSAAQTTVWSTIPTDSTTKADDSTTKTTTTEATTTEAVVAEGAQVLINSTWFDGDGNFCAAVDNQGWGKIKSNSMRIPIYIDGVEAEKPATLQISSSVDGDGYQYVFVNLSNYDVLEFGTAISFTIPEGFLKNTTGTRYNFATEVSM